MSRTGRAINPKWIPLEKAKGKTVRTIGSLTLGDPLREMDVSVNFTDGTRLVISAKAELEFEFLEAE